MSRRQQGHRSVRGSVGTEHVILLGTFLLASVFALGMMRQQADSVLATLGGRLPGVKTAARGKQTSGSHAQRSAAAKRTASAGKPSATSRMRTTSRPTPRMRTRSTGLSGGGLGSGSTPKRLRPDGEAQEKKPVSTAALHIGTFQVMLAR